MLRALAPTAALLIATGAHAETFTGKISKFKDGDSFVMHAVEFRLHGLDAPEESQPFSEYATQMLKMLAEERELSCEKRDVDQYKRVVARCIVGGRDIGEVMVQEGAAWAYDDRKNGVGGPYLQSMRNARLAERGVWEHRNPTEPWTYRKGYPTWAIVAFTAVFSSLMTFWSVLGWQRWREQ